jgi:BolA protein
VSGETVDLLQQRLTAALQPAALAIRDDSHLHAGHAGARAAAATISSTSSPQPLPAKTPSPATA